MLTLMNHWCSSLREPIVCGSFRGGSPLRAYQLKGHKIPCSDVFDQGARRNSNDDCASEGSDGYLMRLVREKTYDVAVQTT